jgi:DNA polymerase-1
VHDELVLEVHPDDLAAVRDGVELRMRNAAALSVPLVVDLGVGAHWGEAH